MNTALSSIRLAVWASAYSGPGYVQENLLVDSHGDDDCWNGPVAALAGDCIDTGRGLDGQQSCWLNPEFNRGIEK